MAERGLLYAIVMLKVKQDGKSTVDQLASELGKRTDQIMESLDLLVGRGWIQALSDSSYEPTDLGKEIR